MTATLDSASVAHYLTDHPRFFEEHAGLLGEVKLSSPLTGRAISLQERQMEVMREKYRNLELRMVELVGLARENTDIATKFHGWTQSLLLAHDDADLARVLLDSLQTRFDVPQATLRLWQLAPLHAGAWFTRDISAEDKLFADGLQSPYCGGNHDFNAVRWLENATAVRSTALLPLRAPGRDGATFGLLVLGSPDPERFATGMATDFLVHIGETAGAALGRLRA
jgi:uncharacterized protein YigA (DUF484 family)